MRFLTDEKEIKIDQNTQIIYFYVIRDPLHLKMLTSLKKMANKYSTIIFTAIDLDQFSNLARGFEITSAPTVVLFRSNKEKKRITQPFNEALNRIFVDIEKENPSHIMEN